MSLFSYARAHTHMHMYIVSQAYISNDLPRQERIYKGVTSHPALRHLPLRLPAPFPDPLPSIGRPSVGGCGGGDKGAQLFVTALPRSHLALAAAVHDDFALGTPGRRAAGAAVVASIAHLPPTPRQSYELAHLEKQHFTTSSKPRTSGMPSCRTLQRPKTLKPSLAG